MTTPPRPAVQQAPESFRHGYADGQLFAGPDIAPPGVAGYSYWSGIVEGRADTDE